MLSVVRSSGRLTHTNQQIFVLGTSQISQKQRYKTIYKIHPNTHDAMVVGLVGLGGELQVVYEVNVHFAEL